MRRPTWLETLLLIALAVAMTALLVRDGGPVREALAGGGGGANGVVALTAQNVGTGRAELLYIVDTAKQRICVYSWNGTRLGLVAARAFDYDLEVLDSSGDKTIESAEGAARGYVKAQVESFRRQKELQPPK
ncbi:MAG TPA: hypothetical protein PK280_02510 [Planctomycetota bacterium]|nr:hypothetical protein [Planctomycetota bacterium]